MKRNKRIVLALTLVVALTLSLLPGMAFADNLNYYDEWGDFMEWTDEQWEQSNSWTDAEWEAYDQAMFKDWENQRKEEEKQMKLALGFTNMDGANVSVNGKYIDFGQTTHPYFDEAAYMADYDGWEEDFFMIPARPLADALGAELAYVGGSPKAFTMKMNGTTINFANKSKSVTLTTGTEKEEMELLQAPFIDGAGYSYIPASIVSDAFGIDLVYDWYYDVAEFIDPEAVISAIDEKFTIYNKLLADQKIDMEKIYATAAEFLAKITLYGDEKNDDASVSGKVDIINQGYNMDITGTLALDLDDISDSLLFHMSDDMRKQLAKLKSSPLEIIVNGDENLAYMKSPLYSTLGVTEHENNWYMSEFLMAGEDFMTGDMTVGKLYYSMNRPYSYSYGVPDTYNNLIDAAGFAEVLLGDKYLKKTSNGYEIKMGRTDLLKAMSEAADGSERGYYSSFMSITPYDIQYYLAMYPAAEYKLTLTEKDGVFDKTDLSFYLKGQSTIPYEITAKVSGNQIKADYMFELKGRYIGKLLLEGNAVMQETTKTPRSEPPAGATVEKPYYLNDDYEKEELDYEVVLDEGGYTEIDWNWEKIEGRMENNG